MNKKNNLKNAQTVIVKDLVVMYGNFCAVDHISFEVSQGEIFGFLGANGAGKTSTIRVLCGLIPPSSGFAKVAGIPFNNETNEKNIKRKVGYMSQKLTLYSDLTVEENLSFSASLRGMSSSDYLKRRDKILNFISFQKPLNTFVKDLSGGIKQQVALAGAIIHDPEIIFLDEPTAGVSPLMRARFWDLIKDLAAMGKTLFVTTHYMDEAEQCERIALMRSGKIVALDSPDKLKKTVFPDEMFEFIPQEKISYSQLEKLSGNKNFEFFEPYGLRFHAVFKKTNEAKQLKKELLQQFEINQISPTLEDVFIRKSEEVYSEGINSGV